VTFAIPIPAHIPVTLGPDDIIKGVMIDVFGAPVRSDSEGLFIDFPDNKVRLEQSDPRMELIDALRVIRKYYEQDTPKPESDEKIIPFR
jgi:hypothetical protein